MRSYVTDLERENEKLKRDIQRLIQKDGVRLSKEDSADMLNVMKDSDIAAAHPDENSYQRHMERAAEGEQFKARTGSMVASNDY